MNNSLQHRISKLVIPLVEGICKYCDDLEIKERIEGDNVSILVSPHMADYPKLCGQDGRQIKALRFIVKQVGIHLNVIADIDLKESWRGQREEKRPFAFNPDFQEAKAVALLNDFRNELWPLSAHEQVMTLREDGDRLHIYLTPANASDASIIIALADIFYPYGYRNGRKIVIHVGPENSEHRTIRQSAVPGGERER